MNCYSIYVLVEYYAISWGLYCRKTIWISSMKYEACGHSD